MSIDAVGEATLAALREDALEWARNNGLLINLKPAPLSLLPTKFPNALFNWYNFFRFLLVYV